MKISVLIAVISMGGVILILGVNLRPLTRKRRIVMMIWFMPKFIARRLRFAGLRGVKNYYKATDIT